MKRVVYTDNEGFKWAVLVPIELPEELYHMGIVIGPIDITFLNLSKDMLQKLHNALVDNNLDISVDIRNKRNVISKLVKDLGLNKDIERAIYSLYQK